MVEMIQEHQNISKKEAWNRAVEALKLVGIPEAEKRMEAYPHELSGGMCQRVIIAMAVCGDPKLIIADEPTTALDVTVQAQVLELLRGLQKKLDTAILLITHNLGVVWDMCDTVMVMYAGNTVEYADTKTLYKEPMHPYTWGLLDSMPKLSSTSKEELTTIPGTPPDLRLTGRCCNFYNRCPYVTDKCRESVPPLVEVEPGHFVACHRQNGAEHLVRGEVNRHGE
jgi:oligopeptide transport system ATP-binding protein